MDILPISGMEWDLVATCHSTYTPELNRSGDRLKKRIDKLSKTNIPTGNPNMPKEIHEAQEIHAELK
jgi:hypothetical protein